ncbi:dipeptidyl aminopeptidase/acylaminoacyl peptidase [Bacillus oleivorans]|uniref:Dipeptidyl aminopeptidase/acylaminoacyl peptidase n=1 Tax=Bacillus oleivorans TaxID=1448271 RepID=A0A285D617_9BACI|nr:S9 family peptidase [Bacillus oleivorans]SNX74786.1 dipeptidyl aminopeptidase/acylaminoacyl peptidase [Bacillus oleivorans]
MGKRLLEAEDLLKLQFVGDPQVSPKNDHVAYVLTKMDLEKDGYYSSIYVSDLEGNSQQVTYYHDEKRLIKDTSPKWSPDGSQLAFLSNRTGNSQVWTISLEKGGEATPLTNVKGNIVDYVWSPSRKKLALTIQEPNERNESKSDVQVITRLRYKADGIQKFIYSRKHIYLFDLETKTYTKITEGDFDFYGPQFSPDGQNLVYIGSKEETHEIEYIPSIWKYDLVKNEETLVYQGKGPIRAAFYSPDGKWIGFIAHEHGEASSHNLDVWAVSPNTREVRNLSGKLNRTADNLIRVDAHYDTGAQKIGWNENSSAVYFLATNIGNVQLFCADLEGNVMGPLSDGKHTITSFDMIDDNEAVFVQAHCHSTGDLVIQNINLPRNKRQLTRWNDSLLSEIKLSTPEHIRLNSFDGLELEGWLLHPTERNEGGKHPLVLQIHGGPHSAYGYGFQHEWQLMAAKGYAVLYTNPRGSQGYGQEFLQKVVGDWGGDDYKDQMHFLDYVLDKFDYIDQEQLFVTGTSYGGYMTNMITARTHRFKAAATINSVTNLYSMFGTSDIGFYFNSAQLGGADMWEDEETVMKYSPIRYANKVKTPTIILHSEADYRCPIEQGEQWYIALRRRGVPVKLVRFPDESHGIASKGKPSHRLERLTHLIDWFEQYRVSSKMEDVQANLL